MKPLIKETEEYAAVMLLHKQGDLFWLKLSRVCIVT